MDRRTFLGKLGVAVALTAGAKGVAAAHSSKRIFLYQGHIAGLQYYAGAKCLPRLRKGDVLTVIPEPENRYDEHALAIYWEGEKLGYLPREDNQVLSRLAAAGLLLYAEVSSIAPKKEVWRQVGVRVGLEEQGS